MMTDWSRYSNPRPGSHQVGEVIIRSDYRWKDFVYRYDVPAKVLKDQFDWTNEEDYSDSFFKHHNIWYHTSQFMRVQEGGDFAKDGWDGYEADSFSSGTVLRLSKDGEQYMVGTYRTAPR